jgi:hypothetical protein
LSLSGGQSPRRAIEEFSERGIDGGLVRCAHRGPSGHHHIDRPGELDVAKAFSGDAPDPVPIDGSRERLFRHG